MPEVPQEVIDRAIVALNAAVNGNVTCLKCMLKAAIERIKPYASEEHRGPPKDCC